MLSVKSWALAGLVSASLASNPADRLADQPMDQPKYDYAHRCTKNPTKGASLLKRWLLDNSSGRYIGIMRCETWGKDQASLHAEGRAVDWGLDVSRPQEKREARRLIELFLAEDRNGNPQALATRMGIQEIIYDCRIWHVGLKRMKRYEPCKDPEVDRTTAHRDHLHIGLNRSGAAGRTSFWSDPRPPKPPRSQSGGAAYPR